MRDWTELVFAEYGGSNRRIERVVGKRYCSNNGFWIGRRFDDWHTVHIGGMWPGTQRQLDLANDRIKELLDNRIPMNDESLIRIAYVLEEYSQC